MKKKLCIIGAILCVAIGIGLYFAADYMLRFSLTPAQRFSRDEYIAMAEQRSPELKEWLDSIDQNGILRDTFIVNEQGTRLHAYLLPAPYPTTRTAVVVHGYTDYALKFLTIGYIYNQRFLCNVILPDLYAHGLSEGDVIQMGWKDRLDVKRWTQVAHETFDCDTIFVHGVSMGAATTMMLSGEEDLPDYVRAFVADCGYTSVWDEFAGQLKEQFGLPTFPILHASSLLCKARYGWSFKEASAEECVKRCSRPMFFIHGDADTFVPTDMVHDLFKAKPEPREIWIVPGVKHARAAYDAPLEYPSYLKVFYAKYHLIP